MPNYLNVTDLMKNLGFDTKEFDLKNPAEAESLQRLHDAKGSAAITIETWRKFVHDYKNAIEKDLVDPDTNDKKRAHLLARLENALLMESYFDTSDQALKFIQTKIDSIKKKM